MKTTPPHRTAFYSPMKAPAFRQGSSHAEDQSITTRRLSAKLPRPKEMQELLAPELGEELTKSQQASLLRSGVDNWNRWYAEEEEADLSGADLSGADLFYANLTYANLYNANLTYANLYNANLRRADLQDADLQGTHYNAHTIFPKGFDPVAEGMKMSRDASVPSRFSGHFWDGQQPRPLQRPSGMLVVLHQGNVYRQVLTPEQKKS